MCFLLTDTENEGIYYVFLVLSCTCFGQTGSSVKALLVRASIYCSNAGVHFLKGCISPVFGGISSNVKSFSVHWTKVAEMWYICLKLPFRLYNLRIDSNIDLNSSLCSCCEYPQNNSVNWLLWDVNQMLLILLRNPLSVLIIHKKKKKKLFYSCSRVQFSI